MKTPNVGDTVTCAETGTQFVIAKDGCTFNYAIDAYGYILSDEGVRIVQENALNDRSQPFTCYVSSDGEHVTGWKGNVLGTVVRSNVTRSNFGGDLMHVRVRDIHGGMWYGKGAGRGMCINLYPMKGDAR